MCELHAEVANVTCECDFWMCYAYCAKKTCEDPVVAAGGAQRCAAVMLVRLLDVLCVLRQEDMRGSCCGRRE